MANSVRRNFDYRITQVNFLAVGAVAAGHHGEQQE
jgi:hypothetical protein